MSLVTVSKKRNRVYHRMFDHDEARRLHAEGIGYTELARRYGVTYTAIERVCNPKKDAYMRAKSAEFLRASRKPCRGGCGRLVWMHGKGRSGYCQTCLAETRNTDVRDSELRCKKCREWKPDEEFPTYSAAKSRRGHNPRCRPCLAKVRSEYRKAHPETERAAWRRAHRKRREKKVPATYIVLRPNGHGYIEECRVEAASPAHAVEQAAQEAGDYIAVPEGKFQVMTVAPVQAFRVVTKA